MHRDGSAENPKGNRTDVRRLGWHAEDGLWLESLALQVINGDDE
jgi:hypothetical protein